MDDFFLYWELIPNYEKFEDIGKEIVKYKRNLPDPEISARDLPQNVIDFFQVNLIVNPYPTWEILYHIIDIRNQEKNRLLEELVLNALSTLIDLIIENPDQQDKKDKLYNLLSNFYVSEWCMNKVKETIIPRLFDLKENRGLIDEVLLLSLLSRSVLTMLQNYCQYEREHTIRRCQMKPLFLRTCHEKIHFIGALLDCANDTVISKLDHKVFHHLRLFRLILQMGNISLDGHSWWSQFEAIDANAVEAGSAMELCHIELKRLKEILQFLNQHDNLGNIDDRFLTTNHMLNHLLGLQVNFNMKNAESIRNFIQINHELSQQQRAIADSAVDGSSRTEVELFNEFMIVKLYLNIIQSNAASQETIDEQMSFIRTLLKSINDGKVLFQLIQNVFTLLFLRFEHIRKTKRKRSGSLSFHNSHTTDVSDTTVETLLTGFVCLKMNLISLLNSLRLFLMGLDEMEVYKSCDNLLKAKFGKILRNVDNALWRLRIIESEGAKKVKSIARIREWITTHSEHKVSSNGQTVITSDEEKIHPRKKVYRKKLKKRIKLALGTEENDEASDDPIEFQLVTESSITEHSGAQSRSTESQRKVRSIMSKVLMGPESLLAVCMLKNDQPNVKRIISEYNLHESETTEEIKFINRFRDTKAKLLEITERFKSVMQRQKTASMTSSIEIDDIKNAAEVGFEKAKFLNLLENFTKDNKLKLNESDIKRLSKVSEQYPNLRMYQGDFINILPIIDFMTSLPCPYELNHSIYKYIMKQWEFSDHVDGSFSYSKYLQNLMDILTVFKNHNVEKTIAELFNDDILTFEPKELSQQLENRWNVMEMLKLDVDQLDDESKLSEVLKKFEMFQYDENYLKKILSYVSSVRQLLKFISNQVLTFGEIMKTNLDDVVGKIIFEQQYSPEQVENFSFNCNINLIHSMAVSSTGIFLNPRGEDDERLLSSFHQREFGEASKQPVLPLTREKSLHTIRNMDILYYIKRQGSFMVAYLIRKIQKIDYKTLKYGKPNFVERLEELEPLNTLMSLYGDKKMVTAIHYNHIDLQRLFKKISETKIIHQKLKMLTSISERQWSRNREQFNDLKDSYIEMLIMNVLDGSQEKFAKLEEIENVRKFCEILLKCIGDIESDGDAEKLLRWCLIPNHASELEELQLIKIKNWMKKIKLYREIVGMFQSDGSSGKDVNWAKVKSLADENSAILVNYLLNVNPNLVLCFKFLRVHPLKQRNDDITKMWIEALNNKQLNDQHDLLFKIIETFPASTVIEFFDFALGFIRNLTAMKRVISFLNRNLSNIPQLNLVRYQKFTVSTRIIESLSEDDDLWSLASRPLIILEQFLMNSKIEVLRNVIKNVRGALNDDLKCSSCARTSSNMYQVGENLVYDFDAHHDEYFITNECLDLLLKLYAAKALDFQIIEVYSIPSSDGVSLDSSFGLFQMPKEVPTKQQWVPDSETSHCMCCKRQKFSLLTRRHHCRRCGRVVCSSCSQNRIQLPEIYNDLMVRACLECFHQMYSEKARLTDDFADKGRSVAESNEWKLSGNISNDQMVRDEFNFEYSPNVGLCIAIIDLHTTNEELAKFLLFHCHRLELLLRPMRGKVNPEVDVVLVGKMLKCLAFSAKIRGADLEANIIINHADVVLKVAENGCESIVPQIPMEPISTITIRTIINDLIKVENWKMALELSVKYDRAGNAGVFAAWGVSAIKSGQYRFAREKISLALQPVSGSSTFANEEFLKMLNNDLPFDDKKFSFKRLNRSPPLLHEVLESLESTASRQKVSDPFQSPFRSKMGPQKETSKNVLNAIDSLRKIVDGDYGPLVRKPSDKFEWQSDIVINTPYYDESMFYLLNYGGHIDFLTFLMKNNLIKSALRYVIVQIVPSDLFIKYLFMPIVKMGRLIDLMGLIKKMDVTLLMWKEYIIAACKHLERKRSYNCLYQMQMLTTDLIRAAMTCIKFYLDGSGNYTELNEKAHYLMDAKTHFQTELEKTEMKRMEKQETGRKDEIALKWDLKTINTHINIISLQLEVAKFLAKCEADGLPTVGLMSKIFMDKPCLKTLFGKNQERSQVAILLLVCGRSIQCGFGISFRVIQECSLKPTKVYTTCTKFLAKDLIRVVEVESLVESIKTNSMNQAVVDPEAIKMSDELIAMAVEIAYNQHQSEAKGEIDLLIKLISSKKMKIQCYINSNQLKTAYVLSASMNSFDDIRRIMKQAEITRQENVRRLCEKKLFQQSSDEKSQ